MRFIFGLFVLLLGGSSLVFAGAKEDYDQVKKEYRELKKKVDVVRYGDSVRGSAEMKAANAAYTKAHLDWKKGREEHPEMKALVAKDAELMKTMIKAKTSGDEAGWEKAKAEYAENRVAMEAKASNLEELQVLDAKFKEAAKNLSEIEDRLMRENPEVKDDYLRLKELSRKRSALRKKMRAEEK